jgi:hypothetical protein
MHVLCMHSHIKYSMVRKCEVEPGRIHEELYTVCMYAWMGFNIGQIWTEPLHAPEVRP